MLCEWRVCVCGGGGGWGEGVWGVCGECACGECVWEVHVGVCVGSVWEVSVCSQEYITERVCNSHMVSVPAIWIA